MDRRIMGIETEFGVTCAQDGRATLSPDEVARYLFRKVVTWGRSSNVFLPNGSRLYLDVGSHPEYATAECAGLQQLVTHDVAGAWILQDLVADAQRRLFLDEVPGRIHVLKNNVDSAGNSYGCHENYLVARESDFEVVTNKLVPFLVTRQLVAGAGRLVVTQAGVAAYSLSQRAEHMWEGVSSATTRSRPLINTRDEPHADAERYRRLHIIVGDSSMSETTTLLKVGATHVVLAMLEAGVPLPDLTLESPLKAIRDIASDLTGQTVLTLADGSTMTAHDVQVAYLARAAAFVEAGHISDPHAAQVIDLWHRTLIAVETQDLSLVETEVDWAIKYRLLQRYAELHRLDWSAPQLQRLDLAYHDIDRARGAFYALQSNGLAARVVTDESIEGATTGPPNDTRAALRGRFIEAAQTYRRDYSVDWVHLKLNDSSARTVLCKDPFASTDHRVDQLIEAITHGQQRNVKQLPRQGQ